MAHHKENKTSYYNELGHREGWKQLLEWLNLKSHFRSSAASPYLQAHNLFMYYLDTEVIRNYSSSQGRDKATEKIFLSISGFPKVGGHRESNCLTGSTTKNRKYVAF